MTQENQEWSFHQALHGYDRGHQLLSSSVDLPKSAERTLLRLSDLSGPTSGLKINSYLTGYPIPNTKYYALARTWLASELPRPGCVWTHTLLIPFDQLAFVDPWSLTALFRRPTNGDRENGWKPYRSQITRTIATFPSTNPESWSDRQWSATTLLMESIYEAPDKSVWIAWPNPLDECVVALWAQQWPELRRSFSFCTLALAVRTLSKSPLDLHVTLPSRVSAFRQGGLVPASDETEAEPSHRQEWLEYALDDLRGLQSAKSSGGLREFLRLYASDARQPREAFAPLTTIALKLRQRHPDLLSQVSTILLSAFQEPDDLRLLKRNIYGPSRAHPELPTFSELDILRELCRTSKWSALLRDDLDLRNRGRLLWRDSRESDKRLLLEAATSSRNPLARDVVRGIADEIDGLELTELRNTTPEAFAHLVNRYPRLLRDPKVWSGSQRDRRAVIQLAQASENEAIPKRIVSGLIEAGEDDVARDLERTWGISIVEVVLEELSSRAPQPLSEEWSKLLSRHPTTVVNWLRTQDPGDGALAAVAFSLSPRNHELVDLGAAPWIEFACGPALASLPEKTSLDAASFLVSLLLLLKMEEASQLVPCTVKVLTRAAYRAKESENLTRHEEEHQDVWSSGVKPAMKHERLIRSVARRAVSEDWPPDWVESLEHDPYALQIIVGQMRLTRKGRKYEERIWGGKRTLPRFNENHEG